MVGHGQSTGNTPLNGWEMELSGFDGVTWLPSGSPQRVRLCPTTGIPATPSPELKQQMIQAWTGT